jgi:metal-responsive CopG/Arc/MetJ family transcriptional regulator
MKVQISINDDLLKKLDKASDSLFLSRSGYISMAVNQMLVSFEAVDSLKTMSLAIKKIADTGIVDDVTRHQIEDFERMAKMIITMK